jgi:hypothetical protein
MGYERLWVDTGFPKIDSKNEEKSKKNSEKKSVL